MIRSDLHTHTTFCDGKNTQEETVRAAIEKGLHTIGFSSHSWLQSGRGWCMPPHRAAAYRRGASFILSGDSHSTDGIAFQFDIWEERLRAMGIAPILNGHKKENRQTGLSLSAGFYCFSCSLSARMAWASTFRTFLS